ADRYLFAHSLSSKAYPLALAFLSTTLPPVDAPIESIGLCNDQSLVFFHPIHSGIPSLSLNRKTSFPSFTVMAIIKVSPLTVTCEPFTVTLSPNLKCFACQGPTR